MASNIHALALTRAIESHFREQALTDAFDVIAEQYFIEYTDADGLDSDDYNALDRLFSLCFPVGEDAKGRELHQVISDARMRVRNQGN